MNKKVCVALSHIGNSRENHEDNYIMASGNYLSPDARVFMEQNKSVHIRECTHRKKRFLVAVSDGMGGHSGGEVASLLTARFLSDHAKELIRAVSVDPRAINRAISELNQTVLRHARNSAECRDMGATLCGVIGTRKRIYGFNVGDSRLYRFYDGDLSQLSVDHTEGERLKKMNLLTDEEIDRLPSKNYLCKYIGYGGNLTADIFEIDNMSKGEILLLCSDGLTDALTDKEIAEILDSRESIQTRGKALMEQAISRNHGCGDNITIIIMEFGNGTKRTAR